MKSLKAVQIVCICLLMLAAPTYGQLMLNAGDVYTYQFKTLISVELIPYNDITPPIGGFEFSWAEGTFDAALSVEMFENGTNGPVLTSFDRGVESAGVDGANLDNAWADLQGTVRFTALSGTVTLQSVVFFYMRPIGGGLAQRYSLEVVLPDAATLVAQLVPCAGPRSGGEWTHHGQYVSAVGVAVRQLLTEGRITESDAEDVLTAAARSNCGKR